MQQNEEDYNDIRLVCVIQIVHDGGPPTLGYALKYSCSAPENVVKRSNSVVYEGLFGEIVHCRANSSTYWIAANLVLLALVLTTSVTTAKPINFEIDLPASVDWFSCDSALIMVGPSELLRTEYRKLHKYEAHKQYRVE